jgi:DNA (cytosine-5)-methyltransferase 1
VLVLDLYCGAGGAGRGLQLAGFEVVGVDNVPQPHYPGHFIRADAFEFLATEDLSRLDLIWASPPCQAYSSLKHAPGKHRDADLIGATRDALVRSRKPYAIENVLGARPLLVDPVLLCGTMFGLKTPGGFELQRHRLFETSFPVEAPECRHSGGPVIGIYGGHFRDRRRTTGANHRSGSNIPREHGFSAMGVDWPMTTAEISDAIPPSYAKYIAEQWKRTLVKEATELSVKSWPPPQGDRAAAKRSVATTWTSGRKPMSEDSLQRKRDIFDDIEALKEASKVKITLRPVIADMKVIKKPEAGSHFQCHPDPAMRMDAALLFDKANKRQCFVGPNMVKHPLVLRHRRPSPLPRFTFFRTSARIYGRSRFCLRAARPSRHT